MAYTTIDKPDEYFNTLIYTGNGTSGRSVTGVGFQPDWVWIKNRSDTDPHKLFDVVRGVSNSLKTNSSDQQVSTEANGYVSAFGTDGFTLTAGSSSIQDVNLNNENYVSWNWLASNGTASNTTGSINSTVSVNTASGFSVVTYTGSGSAATVGHGLGAAPDFFVIKRYNGGNGGNWNAYHQGLGATKYIILNSTSGQVTSATRWNNTAPTSTVFTVNTSGDVNDNGDLHVAYCFKEIKGYSKFGSYTGNGSSNGPFVWTGFKPAWVVAKKTNGTGSWRMWDNKREGYNGDNAFVYANLNDAEESDGTVVDFLSNGFKWRGSSQDMNGSGSSYIYMAFAENPFVTSEGVPATAR